MKAFPDILMLFNKLLINIKLEQASELIHEYFK